MTTYEVVYAALILLCCFGFLWAFITILIPNIVKCPRCLFRIASVKVSDTSSLSAQEYAAAGVDRDYKGKHVCSDCWGELRTLGYHTTGNWGLGATAEYLKNVPNFLAMLISVGALVVSVVALLR